MKMQSGVWKLEPGVWSLESGSWSLESGIWSPGFWSLSPESEIWNLESGVCGLRLATGDLAAVTQVEVIFDRENTWFSANVLLNC